MGKKSVAELLDEAKVYWVCPVTGTKIAADDTAAIEAHKQGLIQKEAADKAYAEIKKKAAEVKRRIMKPSVLGRIGTITELETLLKTELQMLCGITDFKLSVGTEFKSYGDMAWVHFEVLPKSMTEMTSKLLTAIGFNNWRTKGTNFYAKDASLKPTFKPVLGLYQSSFRNSTSNYFKLESELRQFLKKEPQARARRMTKEEKIQYLGDSIEYKSLVERKKVLVSDIRSKKAQLADIEKHMEDIRLESMDLSHKFKLL